MSKEVAKKKFQRGLLGIIFGYGFLSLLVTCFCVTRVDPNVIHHVSSDPGGWMCVDAPGIRGDAYVLARHCVDEGIIVRDKDMKVVKLPDLKGGERAFADADDAIRPSTGLTVPEGQYVYHVSDNLVFDKE